ncbi:hypothetical protein [Derxia lacustris]|uniref:hypothetical protein n=1 Tax=Derxia lacustris TaxID=764842 RepID=UPI00111C6BBD|nr:hypothetical protein [Derxia lacustris]
MKFLRNITTALSPRRSQFAKQLQRKRRQLAEESLLAGVSVSGTVQDSLRRAGLEAIDHAFSPDSVIANAMEIYRFPHLQSFYGSLTEKTRATMEMQDPKKWAERLNSFVGLIDVHLTGRGDAAVHLPAFRSFPEYLIFAVKRNYPDHPYLTAAYGFTPAYFNYAIEESSVVFG